MRSGTPEPWPPTFILNQPIALEEDETTEFKEVTSKSPIRTIVNTVEDYAVGFLNAEGGRILWGICDKDRKIVGVSLDGPARDRIRKDVANVIHNIQPAVDPTIFKLRFHSIEDSGNPDLCICEFSISKADSEEPFYNHRGEIFLRLNGVNKKLSGPLLTAWIKRRIQQEESLGKSIDDPKVRAFVQRIRRVFEGHGLEPIHWPRFFQIQRAPFTIDFTEIQTDAALLRWLNEAKVDWIAKTFLVRREWIEGEDDCIHQRLRFDRNPEGFFSTVSNEVDGLIWDKIPLSPEAYFLRWGVGKDWQRKGQGRVFVVLAVPLAVLSSERFIYRYVSDFGAYPWTGHARTNIQLRSWARLLSVNKGIECHGREIPFDVGRELSNGIFLRDVIVSHSKRTRDEWHPADHALYPEESGLARDTDSFPAVVDFLRKNNLPWENTKSIFTT